MDAEEDRAASREELERALYSVNERTICDYFQREKLWALEVSPVLLAAATLQAMVRSSPVAHHRCYPQALQLLEYIHSESPPPGTEVEYVDLLVELKTRAVLYELFEEVSITDQLKEEVLAKFLGEPPIYPVEAPKTAAEYSKHLHSRARLGLERVLSSDQQWLDFRRTHLFDQEKSQTTDAGLLRDIIRYLTAVRNYIKSHLPAQHTFQNGQVEDGSCDHVSETDASDDVEVQSPTPASSPDKEQRSSSKESSDEPSVQGRQREVGRRGTQSTDSTDRSMDTDSKTHVNREPYNLRRQDNTERESVGKEERKARDRERRVRVAGEGKKRAADLTKVWAGGDRVGARNRDHGSSSFGLEGRRVLLRYGLTPVKLVRPTGNLRQRTPAFPTYATPPRTSVRLALKRLMEGRKKKRLSTPVPGDTAFAGMEWEKYATRVRLQQRQRESEEEEEEKEGVAVMATGLPDAGTSDAGRRYQLRVRRQRMPDLDATTTSLSETETEDVEEVVPLHGGRTAGKKQQRSKGGRESSGSPEPAVTGMPKRGETSGHHQPRRKRRVVFCPSSSSSPERNTSDGSRRSERIKAAGKTTPAQREPDSGGGDDDVSEVSPRRSRRKQVTPRRLIQQEKLVSRVHFSQCDEAVRDTTTAAKHNPKQGTSGNTESNGADSPNKDGGLTGRHSGPHVPEHGTDSSSNCETAERGTTRTRRHHGNHARHRPHPPSTSSPPRHRVVDLADCQAVEQSQPHSQWDYVAVQTVAAGHRSQLAGHRHRSARRRTGGGRGSELESDHEQVACSSDEVALAPLGHRQGRSAGSGAGDKLSVVSESSPGSSSPVLIPPALLSLDTLRKRLL